MERVQALLPESKAELRRTSSVMLQFVLAVGIRVFEELACDDYTKKIWSFNNEPTCRLHFTRLGITIATTGRLAIARFAPALFARNICASIFGAESTANLFW